MNKHRNKLYVALVILVACEGIRKHRHARAARPQPAPVPVAPAPRTQPAPVPIAPAARPQPTLVPMAPAQPRPAAAGNLSQLHFGTDARTKARRKRFRARLGVACLLAAVLGVPGVNLGFELLGHGLASGEAPSLSRSDLRGITTSQSAEGLLRLRGDLFQSRPTPTPTPTHAPEPEPEPEPAPVVEAEPEPVAVAAPAPAGSVSEILYAAAAEFGLDGAYLVSVASCESGLNPAAVNPAGYHGLFQFAESTWASYGYGSIYDPVAQGRTAARMLAAGMAGHWPNCA